MTVGVNVSERFSTCGPCGPRVAQWLLGLAPSPGGVVVFTFITTCFVAFLYCVCVVLLGAAVTYSWAEISTFWCRALTQGDNHVRHGGHYFCFSVSIFFFYFTGCQTAFFFFPLKPPQPYLLPSAENINPRSPKPYRAAERENFMKDERAVLPSYTFSVWQYLAVLTMKQHFLQGSHLHFKVCSSFSAECFSFRWK